jgi:hypothetical protein
MPLLMRLLDLFAVNVILYDPYSAIVYDEPGATSLYLNSRYTNGTYHHIRFTLAHIITMVKNTTSLKMPV